MVLVARLPELNDVRHWAVPSAGAHGIDIDHRANLLYVACDGGALVELDTVSGEVHNEWRLVGGPDATFFNPKSGLGHGAIGHARLLQFINPRTGSSTPCHTTAVAK